AFDHVGGTAIAELRGNAGLDEFVVERIQLARVERIAQLTDEVTGADEGRFRVGDGVVLVVRYRETRELDGAGDALLVDERDERKAMPDENLRPLDVIGRQESVGRAARRRYGIAGGIDDETLFRV